MPVYTVHEPPPRRGESEPNPDRFVFVRDGFYFWAFLLGPIWMLWQRLWLTLILFLVAVTVLFGGLNLLGVAGSGLTAIGLLIAVLIGMEAASLLRWTLRRRRWRDHGLVVAPDVETAERRFFDSWVEREGWATSAPQSLPPPAARSTGPAAPASPASPPDRVIGLFPEPEQRR